MTPQETDPDKPMSVQESPVVLWFHGDLLQAWRHECSSVFMGPFEGGWGYLHYLHQVMTCASGQATGREHSHPQKIGLKIY